jgi:aromatic ring-cleaving dioxygenase
MSVTKYYHVHVYFEPDTKAIAEQVIEKLSSNFNVEVGSYHDRPVGPHPTGSCQITVGMDNFGAIIDWLAKNRQGLTIFTHPNTGVDMKDHTEHTIWMGGMPALNLDILRRFVKSQ